MNGRDVGAKQCFVALPGDDELRKVQCSEGGISAFRST